MKPIARRGNDDLLGQGLRYGITGIGLAGLYAAVYWFAAILLGIPAQVANAAGFAAALICGYVLHSRWSFRGLGQRSSWSWGRFLLVSFAGYGLNCLWVWLLIERLDYPAGLAILPIVTLTPIFTFLLNRRWTFA